MEKKWRNLMSMDAWAALKKFADDWEMREPPPLKVKLVKAREEAPQKKYQVTMPSDDDWEAVYKRFGAEKCTCSHPPHRAPCAWCEGGWQDDIEDELCGPWPPKYRDWGDF